MWIYRLAANIDRLNGYVERGYEFICPRRHPDGHDEYLVRKLKPGQPCVEVPFYPIKKEWVVPAGAPGQARWRQEREDEA